MNFQQFYIDTIRSYNQDNQGMRQGQFFMNRLAEVNLDLYRQVPEDMDPFHNDRLMDRFLQWLSHPQLWQD